MSDDQDNERKKKSSNYDPSRRKFLKGVGVAGAGAALADRLLTSDVKSTNLSDAGEPINGAVSITLDVNGQKRALSVEPRTTLLNALRNHLEPAVTGPKLVCDMGTCGACTVIMAG